VIDWIVKRGQALWRKGKVAVKKGVEKVKTYLFPKVAFKVGKESHKLGVEMRGKKPVVMISSSEKPLEQLFLTEPFDRIEQLSPQEKTKAEKIKKEILGLGVKIVSAAKARNKEAFEKVINSQNELVKKIEELAELLQVPSGGPEVGTYEKLIEVKAKAGRKDYTPHHVPPKGLMKWIYQILSLPKVNKYINSSTKLQNKFKDWNEIKTKIEGEMEKGEHLTCILIHQTTHIRKTGTPEVDKYRVHWGSAVREEIEKEMDDYIKTRKEKDLCRDFDEGEKRRFLREVSSLSDVESLSGTELDKKIKEHSNKIRELMSLGRASTQFYMTELKQHAQKNTQLYTKIERITQDNKTEIESDVRKTFGVANKQSLIAVKTAMRGKKKDGTPEQQDIALAKLPPHGRTTWFKYVKQFANFGG
jgi:hypothetical protein